jgi:hypothetical protein
MMPRSGARGTSAAPRRGAGAPGRAEPVSAKNIFLRRVDSGRGRPSHCQEPGKIRPRGRNRQENDMRVMVMVKATAESEAGTMPKQELLEAMGRFNEQLVQAGILLAGEGLHPSARGARVRFDGASRQVVDGPFAETRELVAGFWLWQVRSMDEAIEWVKRCPNPMSGPSEIEIRPVFEAEDFGAELTPELRQAEERLRAQVAAKG